jgi:integrase
LELIELTQIKTGKRVAIPLHPKVKAILEKRDGNFPYYISDVKFNVHIKDVCKLAGIEEPTKGAVLTDLDEENEAIKQEDHRWRKVSGTYPKHELISSHVCRRSYATNYYGEMPTSWLMSITAHGTEKQFLQYVGKSEIDTAQQIADFYAKQMLQAKKEPQMTVLKQAN